MRRIEPARVEVGLNQDLLDRPDIRRAERAALRSQARAVDVAESMGNPRMVSEANHVYLELRAAAGLVAGNAPQADAFTELLAEFGRPAADVRDASPA